jgi:uncharacterized protein (DUF2336 family)
MGTRRPDADRLFSAAVSAFCSIPRPTRHDANQLEDLVMPLFRQASKKTLRFACASLSECRAAPIGLVRALCHENSEICAPLLVRFEGFTEADLITMISRHGTDHARIIAHRKGLHPVVRDLLFALGNKEISTLLESKKDPKPTTRESGTKHGDTESDAEESGNAERVRNRLRTMLAGNQELELPPSHVGDAQIKLREKLRSTAFRENPVFFQTVLADALAVDFHTTEAVLESGSWQRLSISLKALNIPASEAFVLAFSKFTSLFTSPQNAADFMDHYQRLSRNNARREVRTWSENISPANSDSGIESGTEPLSDRTDDAANGSGKLRQAS